MASVLDYRQYLKGETRGRALLSYLPGKMDGTVVHGNRLAARLFPRALNELGYIVDYIDWQDTQFKASRYYDVFIGHGGFNFDYIAQQLDDTTKCIYYASGYYWRTFNELEAARFDALEQRRGVRLPPDRKITISEEFAVSCADGIICLGDSAYQSYAHFKRVEHVRAASGVVGYMPARNFDTARGHFLFYSGDGCVHKGLDLLLEAFAWTDMHLHICQRITPEFASAYRKELKAPNIHSYGKVSLQGEQFAELAKQCAWVITASCSEGCPNSVLECMAYGLIPILTPAASLDVHDFGFVIDEDIAAIRSRVLGCSQMDGNELLSRATRTREDMQTNHTPDVFLNDFREAVRKIML